METTTPTTAGLPDYNGQAHEPRAVKRILAITGALLAVVSAVFLFTAERQLNKEIEEQIGMPLAEFRQLPEDVTSVVETERGNVLLKRRAAFGTTLGLGVVFLLIGIATTRRLRTAVVIAMILLIIAAIVFGLLSKRKVDVESGNPAEQTPTEMKIEKTVIWALLIATFASLIHAGRLAAHYRHRTLGAP
jgi:hypothetical protein